MPCPRTFVTCFCQLHIDTLHAKCPLLKHEVDVAECFVAIGKKERPKCQLTSSRRQGLDSPGIRLLLRSSVPIPLSRAKKNHD